MSQLKNVVFNDINQPQANFSVNDSDLVLQIQAHAPGVYRIRCGLQQNITPEKVKARDEIHNEMLLARIEPVGELLASSVLGSSPPKLCFSQGDVSLIVNNDPLEISLYQDDNCVFSTIPKKAISGNDDDNNWQFGIQLNSTESIHGLGNLDAKLNKRSLFLQSDVVSDRTLPLVWSTKGWGLYVNSVGKVDHDIAKTNSNEYIVSVHQAKVLDLFLFIGNPDEIVNQYTALTGRPGQPGVRSLGIWLDQVNGQTTDEIVQIANDLREQGFGVDTIQMAGPAPFGFLPDRNNVEWQDDRIDNPRIFFGKLEEHQLMLSAPTIPAVMQNTNLFEELEDRGWLLIKDDGDAFVHPGNAVSDNQPFGLLDLTHKDVYKLWVERIRELVDLGLDAVSCDAQFDLPDDITARGGECGPTLRVLYPAMARQALFDAVAGHKTPQEGVVSSTDLSPAVQRYAWQVGPQVDNTWEGLETSIKNALALGDSGVVMQSHYIGNPDAPLDKMDAQLYIRWLSTCVFSGNFHFHSLPQLLPTAFDEETQKIIKHWLDWRYRLVPYVLGIIEDSVRTGMPVQRSMAQAFPLDETAQKWDTQFMFGPALLVAPVLKPGTKIEIYLPKGSAWWDLSTGWRYEGGQVWEMEVGLDNIPVFGREGHILSLGPAVLHTGEFNSARMLEEVWMFGMPEHSPVVMRNRIRVMQMQGSSYIKGLEGLKILPAQGLEVKRRGAEVRISRVR